MIARKLDVVEIEYQGVGFKFSEDGWFGATQSAGKFGKKPAHWLELDSTIDYLGTLLELLNVGKSDIIKTKRGKNGGTWFHPRLAVPFARWLDVRFAIWCDIQIDTLIRGNHPHYDWQKARHESASSFKLLTESLKLKRESQGKDTKTHHYTNEARLVNWCINGVFSGLDRDALDKNELDLISKLEIHNALFIGQGLGYAERKPKLLSLAQEWRANHTPKFEAAA